LISYNKFIKLQPFINVFVDVAATAAAFVGTTVCFCYSHHVVVTCRYVASIVSASIFPATLWRVTCIYTDIPSAAPTQSSNL